MSNPNIPPVPVPRDDDQDGLVTTEADGETILDPDVDDDLVDSASADRLAAGENEEPVLGRPRSYEEVDVVPAGGAGADSGAADAVQVDPDDEASVPNRSSMNDEPGVGSRGPDGHDESS